MSGPPFWVYYSLLAASFMFLTREKRDRPRPVLRVKKGPTRGNMKAIPRRWIITTSMNTFPHTGSGSIIPPTAMSGSPGTWDTAGDLIPTVAGPGQTTVGLGSLITNGVGSPSITAAGVGT